MSFERFVSKVFVGQTHRIRELSYLAEEIINGNNQNILFVAPSGMGKTILAKLLAMYLDPSLSRIKYMLPNPKGLIIPEDKDILFIDEIHLLQQPEIIYPLLDSRIKTILLATNELPQLKEPLVNRCIPIYLTEYSFDEQVEMVKNFFHEKELFISLPICSSIVPYGRGVPRELFRICDRLFILFKYEMVPKSKEELQAMLLNVLSLSEGGLSEIDRRYIEFLDSVENKTASLALISSATGIPRQEIRDYVEPFLIRNGYISISSKGRTLIRL